MPPPVTLQLIDPWGRTPRYVATVERRVPTALIQLVVVASVLAALFAGFVADYGGPLPWIIVTTVVGVTVAVIHVISKERGMMVAEAAVIVLVLVAAGLFLWGMDANADKDRAKAAAADARARLQARSAGPKTYDYVIYAGEDEPGEYSTFDSDWAYPRVAPDVSGLGVTETESKSEPTSV